MASRCKSMLNRISLYTRPRSHKSYGVLPAIAIGAGGAWIGLNQFENNSVSAAAFVNAGNLNWTDGSFIFDEISSGFERIINQNGKSFFYIGAERIKVGDSKGYNCGRHIFKIQMDHGGFNSNYFGIECKEGSKYRVYLKTLGGIYKNKQKMFETPRWKIHEKCEMILDFDEGFVSFCIAGEKVYKVEIDSNRTYYPFISAKAQPKLGWATGKIHIYIYIRQFADCQNVYTQDSAS